MRGRQLLVDGSILDNLPVQTMARTGEGPIVAIDIKPHAEGSHNGNANGNGNGNGNGMRPRTPAFGETLSRVLQLASANTTASARRWADVLIEPRDDGAGLLEFHQLYRARCRPARRRRGPRARG